jgi:ribosomal protein S18 acetylase RimI-like enzyme
MIKTILFFSMSMQFSLWLIASEEPTLQIIKNPADQTILFSLYNSQKNSLSTLVGAVKYQKIGQDKQRIFRVLAFDKMISDTSANDMLANAVVNIAHANKIKQIRWNGQDVVTNPLNIFVQSTSPEIERIEQSFDDVQSLIFTRKSNHPSLSTINIAALIQGQEVGFGNCCFEKGNNDYKLIDLAVQKQFRQHGIGQKLLYSAASLGQNNQKMHWSVEPIDPYNESSHNIKTQEKYKKLKNWYINRGALVDNRFDGSVMYLDCAQFSKTLSNDSAKYSVHLK